MLMILLYNCFHWNQMKPSGVGFDEPKVRTVQEEYSKKTFLGHYIFDVLVLEK